MSVPALLSIYNRLTLLTGDEDPDTEPSGKMHLTDLQTVVPRGPIPEPKFKIIMGSKDSCNCTFFFVEYTNHNNLELEIDFGRFKFNTVFDKTQIEDSTIGKIYMALKKMMINQSIIEKQYIVELYRECVFVDITTPVIDDDTWFSQVVRRIRVFLTPNKINESAVSDFDEFNRAHSGAFNAILTRFLNFNNDYDRGLCFLQGSRTLISPGPQVVPGEPGVPGVPDQ
jgi:hypothetical protein